VLRYSTFPSKNELRALSRSSGTGSRRRRRAWGRPRPRR
jgi:hypothetical protein